MSAPKCHRCKRKDAAKGGRGMCQSCHKYGIAMGRYGRVDAARTLERLNLLRLNGWTYKDIGDAAGVSSSLPWQVCSGDRKTVLRDTEKAILRVPVTPRESWRHVDPIGTTRRVQALNWMGHPTQAISLRLGLAARTLDEKVRIRMVTQRLALRMTALYEEMLREPGTSKFTAARARRLGYAPPLAWDDDTIDAPDAQPNYGESKPDHKRKIHLDDLEHFLFLGMPTAFIAERFRVTEARIKDILRQSTQESAA